MLAYERANRPRIERARMKNRADSRRSRQTKCSRKSERMKKGKYSQNSIGFVQHENLQQLRDVRSKIVVRQDYALWLARRSAGKNHGRCVIQRCFPRSSAEFLQRSCWQE